MQEYTTVTCKCSLWVCALPLEIGSSSLVTMTSFPGPVVILIDPSARSYYLLVVLESTGKKREARGLLEFDDDERNFTTSMQCYHYNTPMSSTLKVPPRASSQLMKSRISKASSIFRVEVKYGHWHRQDSLVPC